MAILLRLTLYSLLLTSSLLSHVRADGEPLLVFAAASLGGPLDSLASRYMAETNTPILIAYGASGSLAQQIRIGADVDLFISADTSWVMRLVNEKNSPVSQWQPFLRNRLLMVTSNDLDHRTRAFGPLDGPTIGKIAIADPEAAPAGRYAAAYLKKIGVYDRIRSKLIIQEDVRGVINAVHFGVADVGFVYASDVAVTGKVRTVEIIPDSLHPPIVYGLATMKGGRAEKVGEFIRFLNNSSADALFAKFGFIVDSATESLTCTMTSADWSAVRLSLLVAFGAIIWILPLGLAVGWWLGRGHPRARAIWETLIALPLVLPPVVVGFGVLYLCAPRGPFGSFWEAVGGSPAFTPYGAIIAAGIVAFPFLARSAAAGFGSVDERLIAAASGFGAGRWMIARTIIWPQAKPALWSGIVLSFGRALGEFGATVIVAGNIPGLTQTIPAAIYQRVQVGDDAAAGRLVLISVVLALVTIGWATALVNRKS